MVADWLLLTWVEVVSVPIVIWVVVKSNRRYCNLLTVAVVVIIIPRNNNSISIFVFVEVSIQPSTLVVVISSDHRGETSRVSKGRLIYVWDGFTVHFQKGDNNILLLFNFLAMFYRLFLLCSDCQFQ